MTSVKKIAIQHPYDGVSETESCARIIAAAAALGIEAREIRDSHDIIAFDPDFVLSLSHQDPKLTPYPTYGLLTAPTSFYETPRFIRNILTYDGYLTVTPSTKEWLKDLCFGARKINTPIGFYANTASPLENAPSPDFSEASLAYVGTNWDGMRHGDLFRLLDETSHLRLFGPSGSWEEYKAYQGTLAFDNASIFCAYNKAGVGLCLEHPDFSAEGVPTSRIFETLASGAIAICSKSSFNQYWFGDSVLYIDENVPTDIISQQILEHVTWIREHPAEAKDLAVRSHGIFREKFTLEKMLTNLCEFHKETLPQKHYQRQRGKNESEPQVGVIMRAGGRGSKFLRRSIASVATQTHLNTTLYLVLWQDPGCLEEVLSEFPKLNVVRIEKTGGRRSECLWAGLSAAKNHGCEFIGILDDDDEYHPNMIATLTGCYAYHSSLTLPQPVTMVMGGSLKAFEEPVKLHFDDIYDDCKLIRAETRHIQQFHFGSNGQVNDRSFVTSSNSMLLVSKFLDREILQNPNLDIAEDYYLWLQFAERGRIAFAPEIIATIHNHDEDQSGYNVQTPLVSNNHMRINRRMLGRRFAAVEDYRAENAKANHENSQLKATHISNLSPPSSPPSRGPLREYQLCDLGQFRNIWLYGASNFGQRIHRMLGIHGIKIAGIADSFQSGMFEGHDIVPPHELLIHLQDHDCILITSIHWLEIAKSLRAQNIHNELLFIEDPLNVRDDAAFLRLPDSI